MPLRLAKGCMMRIVNLVAYRSQEAKAAIRELAALSETADIRSFAFVIQINAEEHKVGIAGGYRRKPALAISALVMLERKLIWESSFLDGR